MDKKPKANSTAGSTKSPTLSHMFTPPPVVLVGAIPEGKVVDFLSGRLVNDKPEEYVRQNIEKALVRQYKYAAVDCQPEFRIKMGSAKPRVNQI